MKAIFLLGPAFLLLAGCMNTESNDNGAVTPQDTSKNAHSAHAGTFNLRRLSRSWNL